MTAVQSDIQKLEALLKSATNERQRKMYLSLLNKARASIISDSTPESEKTTESSTEKTTIATSTKKKGQGKISKEKESSSPPTSKNKSSKKNVTSKEKKALSKDDSILVTEEVSTTNNSTSVAETNQTQQNKESAKTKSKTKKQSKQKNHELKSASSTANQVIFQGVGIIRCTPYIEDEKLFVTIDKQQYPLEKAVGVRRAEIDLFKSEIEQNGSREMLLRVYPNITHHSDGRPPSHLFRFVRYYLNEERGVQAPDVSPGNNPSQCSLDPEEFIFRGIWRVVSHCPSPVITIYRNINRYALYKRLSKYAKQYFVKAQDFPVVWDAPVEAYKHYPARDKSEQMPCYFVQVKAIFQDGKYTVTEMLSEPTLNIPRFIEPKKNRSHKNKSKQPQQTNKSDQKSESSTLGNLN